jgi:hypothetical protein
MIRRAAPYAIAAFLATARAEAQVTLEGFLGTAYPAPTPLRLVQSDEEPIRLTARYRTRAFSPPLYYAYRIGLWREDRGLLLELVHDKLFLDNAPPEVEHFEISHGYNLLTLNRGWKRGQMRYVVGAGAVIAHPETEVRGRVWPQDGGLLGGGYYLAGPTFQVAAARQVRLGGPLFASLEVKVTASYARVPIRDGHASVPNAAFHLLAGLGAGF